MFSQLRLFVIVVLLLCFCSGNVSSDVYYVDRNHPQASDSNNGTLDSPWSTIQHAANSLSAGDIVYVRAGTYEERVSPRNSGNAQGGYISYVGFPGDAKPLMRGFSISGINYIRIIGFEVAHNNTNYSRGIVMGGTCSYIEILNNYFHNTSGQGGVIRTWGATASYITVRGNEFYYANCVEGVSCVGNGWGIQTDYGERAHHWLIEYNEMHRCGDFINIYGHHNIVRNNFLHDYADAYFDGGGGHVDIFQPGSDGVNTGVQYHVYESNFTGNNIESNSHVLQMRDNVSAGDREILYRGNVAYDHGSYALQAGGVDYVRFYNNTIVDMNTIHRTNVSFRFNVEVGDPSQNNFFFNNIMDNVTTGPSPFSIEGSSNVTKSDNLCFRSGNDFSCESVGDPSFVNRASLDYHLQSNSPAINLGKAITTVTSANGSGTSFNVENGGHFCDGFGIAEGDLIKVGSNDPMRITLITQNTITVNRSISWNQGDGVYWRHQDAQPAAGAYDYRPEGYNYDITITSPADRTTIESNVEISTSTTNSECIRFVIFYVNGIPTSKDVDPPFSFTWNPAGLSEGLYTIEATAYAHYADTKMWHTDQVELILGEYIEPPDPPTQPQNPRIRR